MDFASIGALASDRNPVLCNVCCTNISQVVMCIFLPSVFFFNYRNFIYVYGQPYDLFLRFFPLPFCLDTKLLLTVTWKGGSGHGPLLEPRLHLPWDWLLSINLGFVRELVLSTTSFLDFASQRTRTQTPTFWFHYDLLVFKCYWIDYSFMFLYFKFP